VVTDSDNNTSYTWYVRDAQGNMMSTYTAKGTTITAPANLDINKNEQYIYGSSRLGMYNYEIPVKGGPADMEYYSGTYFFRGWKQYELSNHLGNVLSTISDKKINVASETNSSLIAYYNPDIVSAQDYYPFGMVMRVQKAINERNNRFGFNGKEQDNEAKDWGNQQDYGMRIYDPRLGRFLSVDPLTKDYAFLTPYQFGSNNPIKHIDLDGLEGVDPVGKIIYSCGGFWEGEGDMYNAANWFNRNINPVGILAYAGYGLITGKDLDSKEKISRLTTATDLGVQIVTQLTFMKLLRLSSTQVIEKQIVENAKAMSRSTPRTPTQTAAIESTETTNTTTVTQRTTTAAATPGEAIRTPGGRKITLSEHAGEMNPKALDKGFNVPIKSSGTLILEGIYMEPQM